jgi:hypothetical protein
MHYDSAVGEIAEKPLNDGTADALEDIAGQIRRIEAEIADPEAALEAVHELAARLESEIAQASRQHRGMPDIAAFVLNPMKMLDSLRDAGRQTGLQQAAATIRWYLKNQKQ